MISSNTSLKGLYLHETKLSDTSMLTRAFAFNVSLTDLWLSGNSLNFDASEISSIIKFNPIINILSLPDPTSSLFRSISIVETDFAKTEHMPNLNCNSLQIQRNKVDHSHLNTDQMQREKEEFWEMSHTPLAIWNYECKYRLSPQSSGICIVGIIFYVILLHRIFIYLD